MEEKPEKRGMIDTWLDKHHSIYTAATRHAFVVSIRDGSVDLSSFRTWLEQDYLFVKRFVPFVANVLIRAGKESGETSDMEVVLGGLASLNDEIEWFKSEGSKWGVDFSTVVPQKTNQEYRRFMEALMSTEVKYSVMMTAFWAIEAVYQESFAHCLADGNKTPVELTGACQRWGNDGFKQYCSSVKKIAERCLENASSEALAEAEDVLVRVLEHEIAFWEMSRGGHYLPNVWFGFLILPLFYRMIFSHYVTRLISPKLDPSSFTYRVI